VVIGPATSAVGRQAPEAPEMDDKDMELIMKRMKGLGYMS
jgi:hypothetical protein